MRNSATMFVVLSVLCSRVAVREQEDEAPGLDREDMKPPRQSCTIVILFEKIKVIEKVLQCFCIIQINYCVVLKELPN